MLLETKFVDWRNILDRLAPLAVGADGFKVDADLEYNESHRHFSHLMSIYPYRITKPDTELDKIQNSILNLEKYGTGLWVGFSFTWASILYSIAGNGEGARYMLKLFAECFVSSNGFHLNGDYKKRGVSQFHYRPFTLEANMLYSAALAEMFLQSEEGKIRIPGKNEKRIVRFPIIKPKTYSMSGGDRDPFTCLQCHGGALYYPR